MLQQRQKVLARAPSTRDPVSSYLGKTDSHKNADVRGVLEPITEMAERNYGNLCWELDALDPNDLRDLVEDAIKGEIEPVAWNRCATVEKAEQESLRHVLDRWCT